MLSKYKDLYNSNDIDLRQRLSLLYGNSSGGLFVTLLCMSILCFGFESFEHSSNKLIVWLVLIITHTLRFIDNFYTQKYCLANNKKLRAASFRVTVGILIHSLIWLVYSVLFVVNMDIIEITITAIILSGLAGGSITVLSSSLFLSTFYMSCLVLPFSIMGLFVQGDYFTSIGYLGIIFWMVMIASAKETARYTNEVLEIKYDNVKMLKQVAKEKSEAEKSNKALSIANAKLDTYAHRLQAEVAARTEEIYRLSNLDPLTKLSNRTAFLRNLAFTLEHNKNKKFALLFIDLEGFKEVNDGFGHQIGDEVLLETANRLSNLNEGFYRHKLNPQQYKDNICRWGGDEFLILYPSTKPQDLGSVVNVVHSLIKEPVKIASNNISLACSIGIAMYPEHSKTPIELIQYADISMYQHKQIKGSNAVYFNHQLLEEFQHAQLIRDGLKDAIVKKEFSLVFQPIIDIKEDSVWAFEALIRWRHKGKAIGPHHFIPIAEKAGHVIEIGKWVLSQACKQASKWDYDPTPAVSVNVSAIQFIDKGFIDSLDFALIESGIDPSKLHLEITESAVLDKNDLEQNLFDEIAKRGVHISIDDFGTGYSSLNQLESIRFDNIKIDRCFISRLSKKDKAIVRATKLIADEFNANTVAEGIETKEELQQISELGIRLIQGYYFAKPMRSEDIKDWYASR